MKIEIDSDVLLSAIRKYGAPFQMQMLTEECGELIACASRMDRGRASTDELLEECVDVIIMCAQMGVMYGETILHREIARKMERLKLRVGKEQKASGETETEKHIE